MQFYLNYFIKSMWLQKYFMMQFFWGDKNDLLVFFVGFLVGQCLEVMLLDGLQDLNINQQRR